MHDDEEGTQEGPPRRWHRDVHRRAPAAAWSGTQSAARYTRDTYQDNRRNYDPDQRAVWFSRKPLAWLTFWWLWMPAVYAFIQYFILGVIAPGIGVTHQSLNLFIVRNIFASSGGVWGLSPVFWLWLAIGLIGTACITLFVDDDGMSISELVVIIGSVAMALVLLFGPWIKGVYDADKDYAKNYLQPSSQVVCVHDPSLNGQHPSSLSLMYSQKSPPRHEYRGADGRIDTVQIGDVTVKRCDLPTHVWHFVPRSSSYDAASKSLRTKTSTRSGVNVWVPTITYVYGDSVPWGHGRSVLYPQYNRWSALLDGSGFAIPLDGVAEWEGGQNTPHTCLYGGPHNENNRMNRAFEGGHTNNLRNVIASEFPNLRYDDTDIAGYCDQNDQPVVVISVTRTQGWLSRTVQVPAGILVMRGSPSGNPVITYHPNVDAGQYPVSVYPLSVAQTQRQMNMWWAGRGNMGQFGYDTSTYASQADNSGEYILRSTVDGRMYAVTPQRPSNSQSQQFVNTSMIPVDSVHAGHMNQLRSYVLPDGSSLVVNPANLNSAARSVLMQSPDGAAFLAGHGVFKEFLPLSTSEYRGYGEDVNGNTVIYFDLSTHCGSNATVVTVDPNSGGVQNTTTVPQLCSGSSGSGTIKGQVPVNDSACAGLSSIRNSSPDKIFACQQALEGAMLNQLKQANGTISGSKLRPSPSPSATPSGKVTASPSPSG